MILLKLNLICIIHCTTSKKNYWNLDDWLFFSNFKP